VVSVVVSHMSHDSPYYAMHDAAVNNRRGDNNTRRGHYGRHHGRWGNKRGRLRVVVLDGHRQREGHGARCGGLAAHQSQED
jgi:hypothetical protein